MPNSKTVAIIESDYVLRKYLERLLAASGYATESFATADEFLAEVATFNAECVVLDIELKDSSGRELVHHPTVRALQCPMVFITGATDEDLQRQAVRLSGAEYVRKPIRALEFLPAVARATRTQ